MKKIIYVIIILLVTVNIKAQPYKFYYSNSVKILKNNNDTMLHPFTGGMNCPQFFNMDLNRDGVKDIVIFDRSMYSTGHKLMTFLWIGNRFVYAPQYESRFPEMQDWVKLFDNNGDGKEEIFTEVSKEKNQLSDTSKIPYPNGLRIFKNISDTGGLKFKLINNQILDTGRWYPSGQYPPIPVGVTRTDIAAFEDLDGDGDIDILGFNSSMLALAPYYYENWTINPQGIKYNPDTVIYIFRDDCWGYMLYDVNSGKNMFRLNQPKDVNNCYVLYKQKKHAGTTLSMIDLNGDGIKDLIYGDIGFDNLVALVNGRKQNSLGRDSIVSQDTSFPSNTTPARFTNQPAAYYVDIDNDNKKELLVSTNNPSSAKSANNVWVYKNTGTVTTPVFSYQGNNFIINNESVDLGTRSVPVVVDIDKDGDKDLIVATNGDYAQTMNYNDRLVLYKNISSDSTKPVLILADTNFLMLSKDTPVQNIHPSFGDLNGDGKDDLIIGDANGYLLYYINQSSGTNYSFILQSRKYANIAVRGYAAPQLVDLNRDGKLDLVIGNKQGTVQYFVNTGTKTVPQFASVPTIDSLGGVFVNKIAYLAMGYTDSSKTGYATPFVYDLDNDGNYEMMVGSESGYLYLYTNVTANAGAKFNTYKYLFDQDAYRFGTDSMKQFDYNLNFGARTAPCITDMDGDGKPDVFMGNIRGGLNFFSSKKEHQLSTGETLSQQVPKIMLYPNPAQQFVNITSENMNEDIKIEIFNEVGKLIDTGVMSKYHSVKTISTADYGSGLYFIVFKGDAGYSEAKRLLIIK